MSLFALPPAPPAHLTLFAEAATPSFEAYPSAASGLLDGETADLLATSVFAGSFAIGTIAGITPPLSGTPLPLVFLGLAPFGYEAGYVYAGAPVRGVIAGLEAYTALVAGTLAGLLTGAVVGQSNSSGQVADMTEGAGIGSALGLAGFTLWVNFDLQHLVADHNAKILARRAVKGSN